MHGMRKQNPPTRASCLYCGAPIDLPDERKLQAKLNLRPIENWEKGFNIVAIPPSKGADITSVSRYLSIEPEVLTRMVAASESIPIARIESENEANIAVQQLKNFGLTAVVVSDESLKADHPPIRLRSLDFRDGSIVATSFNTGTELVIESAELLLIVSGTHIETKTESVEKRKKKEKTLLHETETSFDEKVIDIYPEGEPGGFRIQTKGFDFSSLGEDKGLVAALNIERLRDRLCKFAPSAKAVDEYRSLVSVLNTIWPMDMEKDFQGRKRTGISQFGYSNVAKSSNVTQFTKYSRLQRQLL